MATTSRAIEKAEKKAASALARAQRLREENKNAIDQATRTAVTMGGALAMAYWQGRNPERKEILGMDAALVIGGGLTVASLMGWAGKQDLLVESLGTGALATWAVGKGFQMGQEALQAAA